MVAMTEPRDPPTGCALFGIYNGMFRRRRSASMTSLHRINGAEAEAEAAAPPNQKPAAHRDSSLARRPSAMPVPAAAQNGRSRPAAKAAPAAEPAAEYSGMAAELDRMILDHQRVKGTAQLVRATSGNMMLHRNLGNLNAGGGARAANERKAPHGYASSGMGNIVREPRPAPAAAAGGQLCRALSHRTDPDKLKEMGNEEYRQGHYAEAVALYDQAIIMDASRPAYWSNKAAALAALGRLIEAVADCKEAVRIDPSYDRAHHRLAGLYLRYRVHLADFQIRERHSLQISAIHCLAPPSCHCSSNSASTLRHQLCGDTACMVPVFYLFIIHIRQLQLSIFNAATTLNRGI
jgi:tetratricopeptide (TPR) repeat protein